MTKDLIRTPRKNQTLRNFACGVYVPQPLRDTFGTNEKIRRSLDASSSSVSLRARSLEASQRLIGSVAFKPPNRHRLANEKPNY